MSSPWRPPFVAALQRQAPRVEVQVATVSPEGLPAVRTVQLQGVSVDSCPYFFTDLRSRKAGHLAQNPAVALVAWFPDTHEQFCLSGRATLHGLHAEGAWAELRQQGWARLDSAQRQTFGGPPPGRALAPTHEREVLAAPPPEFVVVSVDVAEVDWLTLGPPPSRVDFRLVGAVWVTQALTP